MWIRAGEIHRDDLVIREIYRVRRAIVATSALPVASHPRDLEPVKAVRLSTFVPRSVELAGDDGDKFVLKQALGFTTDNIYAAHAAVLASVGYAILPLWLVQQDLVRGTLVQNCPAWHPPTVTLALAYLPNPRRAARVAALIGHMRTELTRNDGLGIAFLERLGARHRVSVM